MSESISGNFKNKYTRNFFIFKLLSFFLTKCATLTLKMPCNSH